MTARRALPEADAALLEADVALPQAAPVLLQADAALPQATSFRRPRLQLRRSLAGLLAAAIAASFAVTASAAVASASQASEPAQTAALSSSDADGTDLRQGDSVTRSLARPELTGSQSGPVELSQLSNLLIAGAAHQQAVEDAAQFAVTEQAAQAAAEEQFAADKAAAEKAAAEKAAAEAAAKAAAEAAAKAAAEKAAAEKAAADAAAAKAAADAAAKAQTQTQSQTSQTQTSSTQQVNTQTQQVSSQAATQQAPAQVASSGAAQAALAYAMAQVGKAYSYGATGPSAFDCSGLMYAAYRSAGVSLPRTSDAQAGAGVAVSVAGLTPGDLVIYNGGSHVGMYIGNGQVVHAADYGIGVIVAGLNNPGSIYATRHIG